MNLTGHFVVISILLYFAVSGQTARPASIGLTGDSSDVIAITRSGIALIGGGGEVPGAFQWMIARSGGGDVVIIRASGNYLYNRTIDSLGKVNSVETLLINSREVANNDTVAAIIRNAEMLFITGGDQSNYMRFWRDSKTEDAINYLLREKKIPVGGTSAGCAILTGFYYSGEKGSARSTVLQNPFDSTVTVYKNDFLQSPFLTNVISDQHYVARNRQGRHVAFMSRIIHDWKIFPKGIAPDERTAVCIDENGNAKVMGTGKAYFLSTDVRKPPEDCRPGVPLQWIAGKKAIRVYELQGTPEGNGRFSVSDFLPSKANGGVWQWWWVENGVLHEESVLAYTR